MLHLCYSNRFEKLVETLADRIDQERQAEGVFHKVAVVVPNLDQADFLELQLARYTGLAANIDFHMLQSFLRDVVFDEAQLDNVELLDRAMLHVCILDLLEDEEFLAHEDLEPVVEYIDHIEDDADARATRRYQLARKLATFFEEYSYSRPVMLDRWAGPVDPKADPVVRWQQRIWKKLTGDDQTIEVVGEHGDKRRFMTLGRMFQREVFTDKMLARSIERIGGFHYFALPNLGETFRQVLGRLCRAGMAIHAYVLNPCQHDWSGLPTARRDEAHIDELRPPDGWQPSDENPALRLWGRIGRDSLHGLEQLAAEEPERRFEDGSKITEDSSKDEEATLLGAIQSDVLAGRPESADRRVRGQDESVRFAACPGVGREVEAVANEIWRLLKQAEEKEDQQAEEKEDQQAEETDDPLQLNDIAIIVNDDDLDKYVSQIKSVFGSFRELPYNVFGLPARSESRLVEAVHLLLELPFGDFKRSELLRLLIHPNVRAHFPGVDAETWVRWCCDLNILHGGSREDHRDTYIDGDLYNWEQGMRRLALGSFLRGEKSEEERGFEHDGWKYYPREISPGESDSAAQLSAMARSLIEDTRWLCAPERKLTLAEWAETLADFVETYLKPNGDDERSWDKQLHELNRCLYALRQLGEQSITDRRFSYRTAYLFALDQLDELDASIGRKFVDGVVVSSLSRLRGLPFEHIFMLGMGEGKLPAVDVQNQLDLRRQQWRRGDVLLSDRDKFAFLETLLAARSGLHLSWVAREATTGETLAPSSLISELRSMLELFGVPAEREGACTVVHPLRRYDRRYGYFPAIPRPATPPKRRSDDEPKGAPPSQPSLHPEAFVEAKMDALHEHLATKLDGSRLPDVYELRDSAPWKRDRRWRKLRRMLALYDQAEHPEMNVPPLLRGGRRRVQISLSKLRQFLETPLQTVAKYQHGIFTEEQGDDLSVENETFQASSMNRVVLLREIFYQALTHPRGLAAIDKQWLADKYTELLLPRRQVDGALATGPFGEVDRKEHLEVLEAWRTNVATFDGDHVPYDLSRPARVFRFGRTTGWHTDEHPAIHLKVTVELDGLPEEISVQIVGTAEPVSANYRTFVTPLYKTYRDLGYLLRGYLSHLVLSAAGLFDEPGTAHERHVILAFKNDDPEPDEALAEFAACEQDRATEQLHALVEDYLTTTRAELMPVQLVDEYVNTQGSDAEVPFEELVLDAVRSGSNRGPYCYGPIKDLEHYATCTNPRQLIARRFKHFFDAEPADE